MASMADLIAAQASTKRAAEPDFIAPDDVEEFDPFDPLNIERNVTSEAKAQEHQDKTAVAFLERRKQAYMRVFGGLSEDVALVLADLNAFCFGDSTVFHQDERIHCLLTGRQEVIRRVQDHTDLSMDALVEKYTRPVQQ